jgi:hypothetical protein
LRRLVITKEKLVGLVLMVINMSYEESSVEFELEMLRVGQTVLIRDVVRELVPIKDSPLLRFTQSLCCLDNLVEDLVDRSQARELSDYEMAPLRDLGELFQF